MKKYIVTFAMITEVTEKVMAESWKDAIKQIKEGNGELFFSEDVEPLDGTSYMVEDLDSGEVWDSDADNESNEEFN